MTSDAVISVFEKEHPFNRLVAKLILLVGDITIFDPIQSNTRPRTPIRILILILFVTLIM